MGGINPVRELCNHIVNVCALKSPPVHSSFFFFFTLHWKKTFAVVLIELQKCVRFIWEQKVSEPSRACYWCYGKQRLWLYAQRGSRNVPTHRVSTHTDYAMFCPDLRWRETVVVFWGVLTLGLWPSVTPMLDRSRSGRMDDFRRAAFRRKPRTVDYPSDSEEESSGEFFWWYIYILRPGICNNLVMCSTRCITLSFTNYTWWWLGDSSGRHLILH